MLTCLDATLLILPMPDDAGHVILPDGVKINPVGRAQVIAAGPGRFLSDGHFLKMDLSPGDVVLMQPGAPVSPHKLNGVLHLFIQRSYILARESGHFADVEESA